MYKLNTEAARAGDAVSAYITETGKYSGRFLRAEKLVSKERGTHGVGFTFRATDGREAKFDVWAQKADGTALPGLNLINAMMACLQVRELTASPQQVKRWDAELQKETEQVVPCFAALMNADIGLLLRAEEYEKMKDNRLTGETGWRMAPFAVFQAKTELMATEILTRKTVPEMLPQVITALRDKPLKKKPAPANGSGNTAPGPGPSLPDWDDDVPF